MVTNNENFTLWFNIYSKSFLNSRYWIFIYKYNKNYIYINKYIYMYMYIYIYIYTYTYNNRHICKFYIIYWNNFLLYYIFLKKIMQLKKRIFDILI
jgi:hypothetical protein